MTCIICELNPLHNGHKYLVEKAADEGDVILIMSGNFTQRGSAAVYDKYTRAKAAIATGADLVLELPYPWCSAGAADFARAGVAIAAATGADRLVFGSGSGDAELLGKAGVAFAETDFDSVFADAAKNDPGEGAAKLRQRILSELFTPDEAASLSNPNDILGIEYCRYAHLIGGIECVPIKRTAGNCVRSATELRAMLNDGAGDPFGFIPETAADVFRSSVPICESALYDLERILIRMNACDIENSAEAEGGLGFRLKNAAGESSNGNEMLTLCATKKYTDARIRRAALYSVLKTSREQIRETPLYTTVLGMGKNGGDILKSMKKSGKIEVLTKAADHGKLSPDARAQFDVSAEADRMYTLLMNERVQDYFLSVTPYIDR